jgi:hypothetical protein
MSLGLFSERLSFPKNFMDLPYLFPCAVSLNGQPITARLVSLSRNSIRLWSRNMTLGMVFIRGESPKWRRFVRAWILCSHVRSRLPDWLTWKSAGRSHHWRSFRGNILYNLTFNSRVVVRTANFEMELGRELLNITAGNFEQKRNIVI